MAKKVLLVIFCSIIIKSLPVSLVSKQMRKQLSIISQTLSSVNITPSGLNISVRSTYEIHNNINIAG